MPHALIDYYKALEDNSRQMLAAAQADDWGQVADVEESCTALVAELRQVVQGHELPPELKHEKNRIMLRILGNDAQIRQLADAWGDMLPLKFGTEAPLLLH
jgi:flagellar protein FliT